MLSPQLAPSYGEGAQSGALHDHVVQFYDSDDYLADVVAEFLGTGLRQGEPAIAIATAPHREAIERRLQAQGFDLARERDGGRLTLLDARETLMCFMRGERPDATLFRQQLGAVIATSAAHSASGRIRAYGEMVDVLWRDGLPHAALVLEELWNELGRSRSFSLLCAYAMGNFVRGGESAGFDHVCRSHSLVVPTEAYSPHADAHLCLREIAALQQRARSLESEVAQRKQLEEGLREALAERRRVEEELRASRAELERQNRDLQRTVRFSEMFVGILGHDLRNPLSAIVTGAALLTRRAEVEGVARPARRILSSAGRMARMIDQLLDFTRIRLGQGLPIAPKSVDLGQVCRTTLDELSDQRPRVELHVMGDPVGEWDGDRLAQLVSNLVGNALTHGTAGSTVQMSVDGRDSTRVRLAVKNHGAIPMHLLPDIFEPLQSSNDRKYEGSSGLGLGLYITQQIVSAHAGAIAVTSSDADGTCFEVDLPRCLSVS